MLFTELGKIAAIPAIPFAFYTAENLWNDPHISKHMLALHLEENTELASRKKSFIERSVAWMASLFPFGPSFRLLRRNRFPVLLFRPVTRYSPSLLRASRLVGTALYRHRSSTTQNATRRPHYVAVGNI